MLNIDVHKFQSILKLIPSLRTNTNTQYNTRSNNVEHCPESIILDHIHNPKISHLYTAIINLIQL